MGPGRAPCGSQKVGRRLPGAPGGTELSTWDFQNREVMNVCCYKPWASWWFITVPMHHVMHHVWPMAHSRNVPTVVKSEGIGIENPELGGARSEYKPIGINVPPPN